MGTSFQELALVRHLPSAEDPSAGDGGDGLLSRAIDAIRQRLCALHGHDQLLQFEEDRIFLRCASCGFETPGWQVGERPPRARFRGEAHERALHSSAISA